MTITDDAAAGRLEQPAITLGGGYALEQVVGDGPLGPAVLARGTVSGRPVLVRLLADHLGTDEVARARFLRTAELACRLSHPNVVRVLDAGVDERPFIVMEYVEGETVAERLAAAREFSAAELLTLTTHLAAGLAHAHASGVVHGGLDPHSILLGRDGVARLTDFGLTRLLSVETPGGRFADPSADIYALGTVLRQVGGDRLPPGLAALVDAALASHAPVRPLAVDVLHQLLTMTGTPAAWLPPAVASCWTTAGQ